MTSMTSGELARGGGWEVVSVGSVAPLAAQVLGLRGEEAHAAAAMPKAVLCSMPGWAAFTRMSSACRNRLYWLGSRCRFSATCAAERWAGWLDGGCDGGCEDGCDGGCGCGCGGGCVCRGGCEPPHIAEAVRAAAVAATAVGTKAGAAAVVAEAVFVAVATADAKTVAAAVGRAALGALGVNAVTETTADGSAETGMAATAAVARGSEAGTTMEAVACAAAVGAVAVGTVLVDAVAAGTVLVAAAQVGAMAAAATVGMGLEAGGRQEAAPAREVLHTDCWLLLASCAPSLARRARFASLPSSLSASSPDGRFSVSRAGKMETCRRVR